MNKSGLTASIHNPILPRPSRQQSPRPKVSLKMFTGLRPPSPQQPPQQKPRPKSPRPRQSQQKPRVSQQQEPRPPRRLPRQQSPQSRRSGPPSRQQSPQQQKIIAYKNLDHLLPARHIEFEYNGGKKTRRYKHSHH